VGVAPLAFVPRGASGHPHRQRLAARVGCESWVIASANGLSAICLPNDGFQHPVIPGPRSGARDPDTQGRPFLTLSAALDPGLADGDPE